MGLLGRKAEEREKGDARISGSGDFACPVKCVAYFSGVNEALRKAGEYREKGEKEKMSLARLIGKVASYFDLEESSIISAGRKKKIADVRAIIGYFAIRELRYPGTVVDKSLKIRRYSALR
ncbi:conserved domain protein [delta proteobacterium NaphS2]|nr:conserved domain protein [delta proteobacterium NaphS2]